ncbi:MAG: hypothetical protein K2F99_08715 [Muribaculaceae bacterium]|nr:hypothetical protein [Muribaculaceae bacterium]
MTIAISFDRILQNVYAHSALELAQNPALDRPALLGERQSRPLRVLAYHALCRVVAELYPIVHLTDEITDPAEADIVMLLANVSGAETLGCTLRVYVEDAISSLVLQSAWPERADTYGEMGEGILKAIQILKAKCDYKIRPSA